MVSSTPSSNRFPDVTTPSTETALESPSASLSHTDEARDRARRVIAASQDGAIGATELDGMMVDAPHLAQAGRILADGVANELFL